MRKLLSIVRTAVTLINKIFKPPPDPHTYKAKFIKETKVLSRFNHGFCLTGKKSLTIKHSYQNALVIGGTGSGKSSTVLIPSLLKIKGNMIVHDPSSELYTHTAGYLHHKGYQVLRLNFTDPTTSIGFNPLSYINGSSDAGRLATLLIQTSLGSSSDQFWNLQAISLLTTAIELILPEPLQFRTLKSVQSLLQSMLASPDVVDRFVQRHPIERVKKNYYTFASLEDKLRTNILATALSSLTPLNDETIAKVTSVTTWQLSSIRTGKLALFIQNPLTEMMYLSSLTSIFFESMWKYLLRSLPKKTDADVFFLIDEASSLYLPSLSLTVANVRKYRTGIMLVWQNYNQMVHLYGKPQADTIASNCLSQLYLSGQSLDTALTLEATLGRYEYKDEAGNRHIRPLLTAPEIRLLPKSRGLLFTGNYPPIKAKLTPYFKRFFFSRRTKYTPPKLPQTVPNKLIYLNL